MSVLIYLIPIAIFLGALGLAGFLWASRSGQFDDPEGTYNFGVATFDNAQERHPFQTTVGTLVFKP